MFDDNTKTLFLVECKSTKSTSIPLTMLRENQISGLLEADKHNLIAGLLVNFRNDNNDTFFVTIQSFVNMMETLNKKSFNIKDLENIDAIRIMSSKKRTRYKYNVENFINEVVIHD